MIKVYHVCVCYDECELNRAIVFLDSMEWHNIFPNESAEKNNLFDGWNLTLVINPVCPSNQHNSTRSLETNLWMLYSIAEYVNPISWHLNQQNQMQTCEGLLNNRNKWPVLRVPNENNMIDSTLSRTFNVWRRVYSSSLFSLVHMQILLFRWADTSLSAQRIKLTTSSSVYYFSLSLFIVLTTYLNNDGCSVCFTCHYYLSVHCRVYRVLEILT